MSFSPRNAAHGPAASRRRRRCPLGDLVEGVARPRRSSARCPRTPRSARRRLSPLGRLEQHVVAGVGVERRVEVDEIDALVAMLVAEHLEIVAVVELVRHAPSRPSDTKRRNFRSRVTRSCPGGRGCNHVLIGAAIAMVVDRAARRFRLHQVRPVRRRRVRARTPSSLTWLTQEDDYRRRPSATPRRSPDGLAPPPPEAAAASALYDTDLCVACHGSLRGAARSAASATPSRRRPTSSTPAQRWETAAHLFWIAQEWDQDDRHAVVAERRHRTARSRTSSPSSRRCRG